MLSPPLTGTWKTLPGNSNNGVGFFSSFNVHMMGLFTFSTSPGNSNSTYNFNKLTHFVFLYAFPAC